MVFDNLNHEIFFYLVSTTKAHDKGTGKSVSIDRKLGEEIVMFFKIDGGYIKDRNPKADFLCYYHNNKNNKREIIIIELKGKDTRHAITQLENTIEHPKIKQILDTFDGTKKAVIVGRGASPRNLRDKQGKFAKSGIILRVKSLGGRSGNINLRELL